MSEGDDAGGRREQLLADAVADYLDRLSREETIDLEGFCRSHSHLAPELRLELETIGRIDVLLGPARPADSGGENQEELPERLSGHKILGEIGSGGMGRVLLASDERLGRKVAIKTLGRRFQDNEQLRSRFMAEARAMARLSHPHIARIYNLGPHDEAPHFVMEYLEGASLTEAARALTLRQKVEMVHKVVLAVDFLHQHQIVHRDLKPANILVGADLEPKVLDFGLALQVDDRRNRLTLAGQVMGTPDYFSPEQARADAPLDARSDVFSLGAILYELLTGTLPFRADTLGEQVERICRQDPVLPRRINATIPGSLQNICLKALEKDPADRYGSAREMAADLERYLAGEPVIAAPVSYARLMAGKIEQHLRELDGWKNDRILSAEEHDTFQKAYDRLVDREDAWILEARRLSPAQVSLYLGAWMVVVGAALVVLFQYTQLGSLLAVFLVAAAATSTVALGLRCWKQGQSRIAIAFLLAFCLLLPIALLVLMGQYGLWAGLTRNREHLEFFRLFPDWKRTTNAQLWWSIALSLPAYFGLRRYTRASVFSLVLAIFAALLCLVTLLRMGGLEWLEKDQGKFFFRLLPFALLFFATGWVLERARCVTDSRYFYRIAVVFTLVACSGVATLHKPYARWLESAAPFTRGQIEYLFMINAAVYLLLQYLLDRVPSPQLRGVAKAFRFVIPGHILTSLLMLGLAASNDSLRREARLFEILLPVAACLFVFGSIPKQMKNFFVSGLVFLAIGIVRLQRDLFRDRAVWPLFLLVLGLVLMLAAANYSSLKMGLASRLARVFPRKNK